MTLKLLPNGNLAILAEAAERTLLATGKAENPEFDTDRYMADLLDGLICNSEYDWCNPEDVGALTSAPILCTRGGDGEPDHAWGFMDYQIVSVQQRLLDTGKAIFQDGGAVTRRVETV